MVVFINHILVTITVLLARAIFSMFPALFFPSQVYTVVLGILVEAKYTCDGSRGSRILFTCHCIVGIGFPSALQYNSNLSPTLTVCGEFGGSIVILGASVFVQKLSFLNIHKKLYLASMGINCYS